MQECIFCKIIAGQSETSLIAETDNLVVIKDISPKAPVHYLIIPKKHVKDIRDLEKSDSDLMAEMLLMAKDLSKRLDDPGDFRLVFNNGSDSGQEVFHMHGHFLSGKKMVGL